MLSTVRFGDQPVTSIVNVRVVVVLTSRPPKARSPLSDSIRCGVRNNPNVVPPNTGFSSQPMKAIVCTPQLYEAPYCSGGDAIETCSPPINGNVASKWKPASHNVTL